jgi:hypothetical protein
VSSGCQLDLGSGVEELVDPLGDPVEPVGDFLGQTPGVMQPRLPQPGEASLPPPVQPEQGPRHPPQQPPDAAPTAHQERLPVEGRLEAPAGVPGRAAAVAAEPFLGGVDVVAAAAAGAGDLAEVDVVGEDEAADQVADEALAAGVGEGTGPSAGEGVKSFTDQRGQVRGSPRGASFRLGNCNSQREEAFLWPLSSP